MKKQLGLSEKNFVRSITRAPNLQGKKLAFSFRAIIPCTVIFLLIPAAASVPYAWPVLIVCLVPSILYLLWRRKPRSPAAANSPLQRFLDPVFLLFPSLTARHIYLGPQRDEVSIYNYDKEKDDDRDDILWYQFLRPSEINDSYRTKRMEADRCSLSQLRSMEPGSDVILEFGGWTYKFFILESISYYPPEEIPPIDMAYQGEPRLTIITHPSDSEGAAGLSAVAVCKPKSLSA